MCCSHVGECRGCSCESKWHSCIPEVAASFYVKRCVWAIFLIDLDSVETGCKVKDGDIAVATKSLLFQTNIALRHCHDFGDSINLAKILTYPPFLLFR